MIDTLSHAEEHVLEVVPDGLVELTNRLDHASRVARRSSSSRRVTTRVLALLLVAAGLAAIFVAVRRSMPADDATEGLRAATPEDDARAVLQDAVR